MRTVLLAWEVGGGLGHLINLLPLARGLSGRGHRVVAVLRDLSKVEHVFQNIDIEILQAPKRPQRRFISNWCGILPTCFTTMAFMTRIV